MTRESELRDIHSEARKIAQNERRTRMFVFRDNSDLLRAKVGEMDKQITLIDKLYDAAREGLYVPSGPPPVLLSPEGAQPRKVEYK